LSLRLLLDEDSQSKRLVSVLRKAGHEVLTINEIGLAGSSDDVVLKYARAKNRILLTHNCDDFEGLHKINPNHLGILAVYRSSNRSKNMSFKDIVHAIANLESATFPLANQFISLNHWNY
jgi:predicted nuclease of predicted toxin-antitoxin system